MPNSEEYEFVSRYRNDLLCALCELLTPETHQDVVNIENRIHDFIDKDLQDCDAKWIILVLIKIADAQLAHAIQTGGITFAEIKIDTKNIQ